MSPKDISLSLKKLGMYTTYIASPNIATATAMQNNRSTGSIPIIFLSDSEFSIIKSTSPGEEVWKMGSCLSCIYRA